MNNGAEQEQNQMQEMMVPVLDTNGNLIGQQPLPMGMMVDPNTGNMMMQGMPMQVGPNNGLMMPAQQDNPGDQSDNLGKGKGKGPGHKGGGKGKANKGKGLMNSMTNYNWMEYPPLNIMQQMDHNPWGDQGAN